MDPAVLSRDLSQVSLLPVKDEVADEVLLQRLARQDELAFGDLYQRYHTRLFTYLVRLTRDEAAAEDLLQEVFLAVWRSAAQFRGQSRVATWLYRIAHYRAVDWFRQTKSRAKAETDFDLTLEPGVADIGQDVALAATTHWQLEQVQAAIHTLPAVQRAVVELAFGQGFAYPEIATILSCPVGTVKSRMAYALRQIQRLLKSKE